MAIDLRSDEREEGTRPLAVPLIGISTNRQGPPQRDNVVYWKEPTGRSTLISDANKSLKRILERISIEVFGLCIHLCVDCDLVVVCIARCG